MTRFLPSLKALPRQIKTEFIAWLWGEGFNLCLGIVRRVAEIGLAIPLVLGPASDDPANKPTSPPVAPIVVADAAHAWPLPFPASVRTLHAHRIDTT